MKSKQTSDRVDRDAQRREKDRLAREREAIGEMTGEPQKKRSPRTNKKEDGRGE